MSQKCSSSQHRLQRLVVQELESLQRSGVQELRRSRSGPPARSETSTRPTAVSSLTPPLPATPAQEPASRPAPPPALKARPIAGHSLPLRERDSALQVLARQVTACVMCPELAETRTQTVFGVGNPDARLCFLGEAPGADEDHQGEPFVGRAGQLLNKIIEACTLRREEVYILNVLKCRPPGNRTPNSVEAANCRPFFQRQLELIQPEFICCLGAVAATTLLETTQPIGRLRGRFHDWRGAKVLVTYHPAYLLRNPSAKRQVWDDMQILMKEMGIT